MKTVPYNHGPDFSEDYAPESYIEQGAIVLMDNAARDAAVMRKFSATGPAAGFDFDTYREACRTFNKAAYRNALVLAEAGA